MKKLFALVGLAVALSASAQTNTPPSITDTNTFLGTLWDDLTTGTNYAVIVDGMYSTDNHKWGGGLALAYNITDFSAAVLRMDYFGSEFYMASGNFKLQPPQNLLGKFPVVPFLTAGVGTPFSGAGSLNGTPVGIVGTGAYLKLNWIGNGWVWNHVVIGGDYEVWTGLRDIGFKDQIRSGISVPF